MSCKMPGKRERLGEIWMFTLFLWPFLVLLLVGARPGLKGRPKRKTLLVMFPSRALVQEKLETGTVGNSWSWNLMKSVEIRSNSPKFGNEDSARIHWWNLPFPWLSWVPWRIEADFGRLQSTCSRLQTPNLGESEKMGSLMDFLNFDAPECALIDVPWDSHGFGMVRGSGLWQFWSLKPNNAHLAYPRSMNSMCRGWPRSPGWGACCFHHHPESWRLKRLGTQRTRTEGFLTG